jgi:hypothetical protein
MKELSTLSTLTLSSVLKPNPYEYRRRFLKMKLSGVLGYSYWYSMLPLPLQRKQNPMMPQSNIFNVLMYFW